MIGYLLSMNLSRATGSRCDVGVIRGTVQSSLARQGFGVESCNVQVNVVESFVSDDRTRVAVSLALRMEPNDMTPGRTRAIDATVMDAIKLSCHGNWDNERLRVLLPPTGNGKANSWTFRGELGEIVRQVSNVAVPSVNRDDSWLPTTPIASTDPSVAIGQTQPPGIVNSLGRAGASGLDALSALKTPAIAIGVGAAVIGVAVIVVKVSK